MIENNGKNFYMITLSDKIPVNQAFEKLIEAGYETIIYRPKRNEFCVQGRLEPRYLLDNIVKMRLKESKFETVKRYLW